jgi:4-alpha-glucanotransferase
MDDITELAARSGVAAEYYDAFGERRQVGRDALSHIIDAIGGDRAAPNRLLPATVVLRQRRQTHVEMPGLASDAQLEWEVLSGSDRVARGVAGSTLDLGDIAVGAYTLRVTPRGDGATAAETATLLVAPEMAYQGSNSSGRMWALAVQLYGIKSRRNWGHGDFTDLIDLLELAARLGAAGIGLNPLHALRDDQPEQASPYYPNSRLFLNPLYIDIEAIPEFPGVQAAGVGEEIERLRRQDKVDYAGVAAAKLRGLRLAYDAFRHSGSEQRRGEFAAFRRERRQWLARFASFEHLRRRFHDVWWEWPPEWRQPNAAQLLGLLREEGEELGFFAFVQWVADAQLAQCCAKGRDLGLPLGLYVDVAVGVEAGGADAWSEQRAVLNRLSIGAPPDLLNTAGQNWGLSGYSPSGLEDAQFEPFRQMLRAAMRYAGAVRLDHVLGLRRLFVIPHGMTPQDGTYVQLPFEALLAVVAQESVRHQCIVIGEDLGTVPEGFREAMADWGLWSYLVMLFERREDGSFKAPGEYKKNALASFNTHDLPTFTGWTCCHDFEVKRAIGLDPGESLDDRRRSQAELKSALAAHGYPGNEFTAVAKYLAHTPSRLVVIAMEDVLEILDQPNLPGTINEHPNWRRRLPMCLEDLGDDPRLMALGRVMREAGRGNKRTQQ